MKLTGIHICISTHPDIHTYSNLEPGTWNLPGIWNMEMAEGAVEPWSD
jgi:hypothetical protein